MLGGLAEPPTYRMRSSGRMLPREMRTDVMPGAFDASFPADHSVEAAEVPTPPTQDVSAEGGASRPLPKGVQTKIG